MKIGDKCIYKPIGGASSFRGKIVEIVGDVGLPFIDVKFIDESLYQQYGEWRTDRAHLISLNKVNHPHTNVFK